MDGSLAKALLIHDRVRRNLLSSSGFTVVDMVFVMLIAGVLMAMAVPSVQNIRESIVLGEAQRSLTSELNQARLLAVSTNRVVRVRFNCPSARYFRTVELVGTPSKPAPEDTAMNRCSTTAFPTPPPDQDPLTLPNHDGPPRKLDDRVSFGSVQTVEFWPDGTAHIDSTGTNPWPQIPTAGIALTVTKGTVVKTVTVNGLGKIQAQ
jgi:type II secretory pathway pseudopilin PulG